MDRLLLWDLGSRNGKPPAHVRARRHRSGFAKPVVERCGAGNEPVGWFTGGDRGLHRSLSDMYEQEGAEKASRGAFDEDLMRYMVQAIAALPAE